VPEILSFSAREGLCKQKKARQYGKAKMAENIPGHFLQ